MAHSKYLTNVKPCMLYNIPVVTLNGIGGKTHPITEAGVLTHVTPQKKCVKFLCYVCDTPVGNAQEILLLGLSTIVDANIDIRYHMSFSVQGISKMIRFLDEEPTQMWFCTLFILHKTLIQRMWSLGEKQLQNCIGILHHMMNACSPLL